MRENYVTVKSDIWLCGQFICNIVVILLQPLVLSIRKSLKPTLNPHVSTKTCRITGHRGIDFSVFGQTKVNPKPHCLSAYLMYIISQAPI